MPIIKYEKREILLKIDFFKYKKTNNNKKKINNIKVNTMNNPQYLLVLIQ